MSFSRCAILASLCLSGLSSPALAKLSCQYGEVNGVQLATFVRPLKGEQDWYGPYNVVQFCIGARGQGNYILIQEELIRGMRVVNPPRQVLSASRLVTGQLRYEIADFVDHVTLELSADNSSLQLSALRFGRQITGILRREASAN